MSHASPRKRGVAIAAPAFLVSVLVAGCSSSDDPDLAPPPASTATTAADPDAADRAEVIATLDTYWAATIAAQNGPSDDPQPFAGVGVGSDVELTLKTAKDYAAQGIKRVGEPTIGEPTVTVSGDTAAVEQCVDESTWSVAKDGVEFGPPPDAKAAVTHLVFERQDGAWIATGTDDDAQDTLSC